MVESPTTDQGVGPGEHGKGDGRGIEIERARHHPTGLSALEARQGALDAVDGDGGVERAPVDRDVEDVTVGSPGHGREVDGADRFPLRRVWGPRFRDSRCHLRWWRSCCTRPEGRASPRRAVSCFRGRALPAAPSSVSVSSGVTHPAVGVGPLGWPGQESLEVLGGLGPVPPLEQEEGEPVVGAGEGRVDGEGAAVVPDRFLDLPGLREGDRDVLEDGQVVRVFAQAQAGRM